MSASSKQAGNLFLEMRTAEINNKVAVAKASYCKHSIMHDLRATKEQTKITEAGIADAAIVSTEYQAALEYAAELELIFAGAQAKWVAFAVANDIPWCANVQSRS